MTLHLRIPKSPRALQACLSTTLIALAVAPPAMAHEGVLAGERPLVSMSEGSLIGGGTTYGLTVTEGGGWQRVCEEASPARPSFFATLDDGRILIGTADGAYLTDDGGCSYTEVAGLEGQYVAALAHRADGGFIVSTATSGGGNGVFVSPDGITFEEGPIAGEDALFFTLVARGDEVWTVGTVPGASSVIYRSLDAGATFDQIAPVADLDLAALSARGFDADGALVLSGLRQGEGFVLIRTPDAFATVEEIAGFSAEITAFAAFGGHRFVVVNTSGLWRQENASGEFAELDAGPGRCLWVDDERDTLWSCGREESGALFYSTTDGETWSGQLDPALITDRTCPAGTAGDARCEEEQPIEDGGTSADAGGDDGDTGLCRCVGATQRSARAEPANWAVAFAVAMIIGRRTRKTRRG